MLSVSVKLLSGNMLPNVLFPLHIHGGRLWQLAAFIDHYEQKHSFIISWWDV